MKKVPWTRAKLATANNPAAAASMPVGERISESESARSKSGQNGTRPRYGLDSRHHLRSHVDRDFARQASDKIA